MGLLEPNVVPGLDRALLELLLIFIVVVGTGLLTTVTSIVGLVRAVRRHRRGGHSRLAVVLAALALAITSSWMGYWMAADIHNQANPLNPLLAINAAICLLPLSWLVTAIRANRAQRGGP